MSISNKTKVNIHIQPELIQWVDAEYELHDFSSRSAFVCEAIEFFLGYLHSQDDTEYMTKTTLSFLENQVTMLDAKISRQMFRVCVELCMVGHTTAIREYVSRDILRQFSGELAQLCTCFKSGSTGGKYP